MYKTYIVTLHVSTEANIDAVHRHFAQQCEATHEIQISEDIWMEMTIDAVGVIGPQE
jgi:hypothetical protein